MLRKTRKSNWPYCGRILPVMSVDYSEAGSAVVGSLGIRIWASLHHITCHDFIQSFGLNSVFSLVYGICNVLS